MSVGMGKKLSSLTNLTLSDSFAVSRLSLLPDICLKLVSLQLHVLKTLINLCPDLMVL